MAIEIEHKYLVKTELWRPGGVGMLYRQGYLSSVKERVVRVRIASKPKLSHYQRNNERYEPARVRIPDPACRRRRDARRACEKPLIEKTRHRESFAGRTWEIDVFHGENDGLVMAEVELENAADRRAAAMGGRRSIGRSALFQQQPRH